jgi:hypothetical protein
MTDVEVSRAFWERIRNVPSPPPMRLVFPDDDDEMRVAPPTVGLDDEEEPLLHDKAPPTSTCSLPRRAVVWVLEWLDVV